MSFAVSPTPVVMIGLHPSKYNVLTVIAKITVDSQKVMYRWCECEEQSLSKTIIDPSYWQKFRQIKDKIADLEQYKIMNKKNEFKVHLLASSDTVTIWKALCSLMQALNTGLKFDLHIFMHHRR